MKQNVWTVVATGILSAALIGAAIAQGPGGTGKGPGQPGPKGPQAGMCQGMGQGMGQGQGGWWNRVQPKTEAQREFVAAVAAKHDAIRALMIEIRTMTANGAPQAEINAKLQLVAGLRAELQQLMTANQALLKEMGVNCPGTCDGTGPKGPGMGKGPGAGKGQGNGVCDGTGPKGNGPGAGQGAGQGKGQQRRQGARNGSGLARSR